MKLSTLQQTCIHRAYLWAFKNNYWRVQRDKHSFLGQFVRRGDLVFDVGANTGTMARSFLRHGASVVAVEPMPSCVKRLRELRGPITVIRGAVGSRPEMGTLHVSSESCFSTMSEEWMKIAQKTPRFASEWKEQLIVPVFTIDELIRTYGMPDFIKIDVEGYESEVLDGLTALPCPIMFEFNSEYMEATKKCLRKPIFEDAEFNYHTENRLRLSEWADANELYRALIGNTSGDVLVRSRLHCDAGRSNAVCKVVVSDPTPC